MSSLQIELRKIITKSKGRSSFKNSSSLERLSSDSRQFFRTTPEAKYVIPNIKNGKEKDKEALKHQSNKKKNIFELPEERVTVEFNALTNVNSPTGTPNKQIIFPKEFTTSTKKSKSSCFFLKKTIFCNYFML